MEKTKVAPFVVRHSNGDQLSEHQTLEQAQARAKTANAYAVEHELSARYTAGPRTDG